MVGDCCSGRDAENITDRSIADLVSSLTISRFDRWTALNRGRLWDRQICGKDLLINVDSVTGMLQFSIDEHIGKGTIFMRTFDGVCKPAQKLF